MTYIHPAPDFRVTLDGSDLTSAIVPRLSSLTITDKRGGEADTLELVLTDHDGRLEIPPEGAELSVSLGWKRGSAVTVGLVEKGRFKVDEVSHGGPPDIVTIRARSADLVTNLRTRRARGWHDTTIGAVVADIAGRNRCRPRCHARLASVPVKALAQSRESDMALLRRLGREHDAVATIKAGTLIFAPIGAGENAAGTALPAVAITRASGDRHEWTRAKRESATGVQAEWHDRKGAKRHTVTVGEAEGARRLSRVYPSEAAARAAAGAEQGRAKRAAETFGMTLALGRVDIYPEQPATLTGFKAAIDGARWLVAAVTHTLNESGFTTRLELELKS